MVFRLVQLAMVSFSKIKIVYVVGGELCDGRGKFLTKFASKVILVHRRDEFRASKIMIERLLKNPKVEVVYNSVVDEVLGETSNNKRK